eukprot:4233347-Amphidinium_carterae.1
MHLAVHNRYENGTTSWGCGGARSLQSSPLLRLAQGRRYADAWSAASSNEGLVQHPSKQSDVEYFVSRFSD